MCPVTGQPDFSSVEIDYEPGRPLRRVEVAQALPLVVPRPADLRRGASPPPSPPRCSGPPSRSAVRVVVTQHVRGGIVTEATAELP